MNANRTKQNNDIQHREPCKRLDCKNARKVAEGLEAAKQKLKEIRAQVNELYGDHVALREKYELLRDENDKLKEERAEKIQYSPSYSPTASAHSTDHNWGGFWKWESDEEIC